jgi:type I restriction enzyme S subunit
MKIDKFNAKHKLKNNFMSLSIFMFPTDLIYPYFLELIINSPFVKNKSISNTQGIGNKSLVMIYK